MTNFKLSLGYWMKKNFILCNLYRFNLYMCVLRKKKKKSSNV